MEESYDEYYDLIIEQLYERAKSDNTERFAVDAFFEKYYPVILGENPALIEDICKELVACRIAKPGDQAKSLIPDQEIIINWWEGYGSWFNYKRLAAENDNSTSLSSLFSRLKFWS